MQKIQENVSKLKLLKRISKIRVCILGDNAGLSILSNLKSALHLIKTAIPELK